MFNNSARDSAALDRHITGLDDYRVTPVILTCPNGHTWRTKEIYDMGGAEVEEPECPECHEEYKGCEPDDGDEE